MAVQGKVAAVQATTSSPGERGTSQATLIACHADPASVWRLIGQRKTSQVEMARLVGTSPGYLSQLMSGTRSASTHMRRRLSSSFG